MKSRKYFQNEFFFFVKLKFYIVELYRGIGMETFENISRGATSTIDQLIVEKTIESALIELKDINLIWLLLFSNLQNSYYDLHFSNKICMQCCNQPKSI